MVFLFCRRKLTSLIDTLVFIETQRCDSLMTNNKFVNLQRIGRGIKNLSNMTDNEIHLLTIERTRQNIKRKTDTQGIPANVYLQVLGSGARGAPRCLYVSTSNKKYMFNCGEGIQRLCHEHKAKLTNLTEIFITSARWENLGGLAGTLLTLQQTGIQSISLHGPEGTINFIDAIKNFVYLTNLTVNEAKVPKTRTYNDAAMCVKYVPIMNSRITVKENTQVQVMDTTNYYNSNVKNKRLITGRRTTDVMCYICKLHGKPGSLSIEECLMRGLKPGPVLGLLKSGQDITLENGTVIRAQDVCSPNHPGYVFIVVECPNRDYLESFVTNSEFINHQATASDEHDKAYCVVHFTPEAIINEPKYREWMNKFDSNTYHIVINEKNNCLGSEANHKNQRLLRLLYPTFFPFLNEECFQDKIKAENKNPYIHYARTLNSIHIRPKMYLNMDTNVNIPSNESLDALLENNEVLDTLKKVQSDINAESKLLVDKSEYPKIIMLGTGSSVPNKIRNTSGILLRIDEENSILLDCGEGTLGQIIKFFGQSKANVILSSIKAIFISHLHADHHLGLIGILIERAKYTKDSVFLIAPEQINLWLKLYHNCFEVIFNKFKLISNYDLIYKDYKLNSLTESELYSKLNIKRLNTTLVKHCQFSYGVALTLSNQYKIVYSGDTMPCTDLIELGKDCDLLIHEATMEDDLESLAKKKLHSTMSQAITIGNQMKARFILLTHFSQRYSKIPILPENNGDLDLSNVGITYDNMEISLSEITLLPLLYPGFKIIFNEFRMILDLRAIKRKETNKRCKLEEM